MTPPNQSSLANSALALQMDFCSPRHRTPIAYRLTSPPTPSTRSLHIRFRTASDHMSHSWKKKVSIASQSKVWDHSHGPVRVDSRVLEVLPDLAEKHLQLLGGPAQHAGEDGGAEPVQTRRDVLERPGTWRRRQHTSFSERS